MPKLFLKGLHTSHSPASFVSRNKHLVLCSYVPDCVNCPIKLNYIKLYFNQLSTYRSRKSVSYKLLSKFNFEYTGAWNRTFGINLNNVWNTRIFLPKLERLAFILAVFTQTNRHGSINSAIHPKQEHIVYTFWVSNASFCLLHTYSQSK